MSIHFERQQMLDKMLREAEEKVASMHPVRRWIGWRLYYLREALKTDRAVRAYLVALWVLLGVDFYKVPMPPNFSPRRTWDAPRDIRLIAWHPVAWPLAVLATLLMILTGGLELVFDNGNVFRKRKNHRRKS